DFSSHVLHINSAMNRSLLIMSLMVCLVGTTAHAQHDDTNAAIEQHRKGNLIIRAKPGDRITVEQLSHEFWFGCAISNSLAGGRWSREGLDQYKEYFRQNFNAAVTENALRWASMEPRRGEVDYRVLDAILEWTEENNIPPRGHNLFWGVHQ